MGAAPLSADFPCAACGASAAVVHLSVDRDNARVTRSCFTSTLEMPLSRGGVDLVREALATGNPEPLYRCDRELASFYCPDCAKAYCGAHWARRDIFEDDWHDSIRGTCPAGHERMLED
jgi:hypothetical protein